MKVKGKFTGTPVIDDDYVYCTLRYQVTDGETEHEPEEIQVFAEKRGTPEDIQDSMISGAMILISARLENRKNSPIYEHFRKLVSEGTIFDIE